MIATIEEGGSPVRDTSASKNALRHSLNCLVENRPRVSVNESMVVIAVPSLRAGCVDAPAGPLTHFLINLSSLFFMCRGCPGRHSACPLVDDPAGTATCSARTWTSDQISEGFQGHGVTPVCHVRLQLRVTRSRCRRTAGTVEANPTVRTVRRQMSLSAQMADHD